MSATHCTGKDKKDPRLRSSNAVVPDELLEPLLGLLQLHESRVHVLALLVLVLEPVEGSLVNFGGLWIGFETNLSRIQLQTGQI